MRPIKGWFSQKKLMVLHRQVEWEELDGLVGQIEGVVVVVGRFAEVDIVVDNNHQGRFDFLGVGSIVVVVVLVLGNIRILR